jgi:hypothetical protein
MSRFDGRWFPSSKTSDWATGKFGTPGWSPAPPTSVTPTEGDEQVALSWTAGYANGSDITGYKVEKNDGSWSTVTSDTGSDATSYTATGLTNGTGYTFRVTAINAVGVGEEASSASSSKIPRGVPGAPGTLSLAEGSPGHTDIDLSWSAGSTNGAAITGYKIQRSTDGSSWSNVVADTGSTGTTYTNTGLTGSTTYHYRVAAINVAGAGSYGNAPSRTTSAPIMAYSTTGSPTLTTYSGYKSLTWTGSGSVTFTGNPNSATLEILTIAGGGGGACSNSSGGGGGGAGGMKTFTSQSISLNSAYTVTVGAAGAGLTSPTGKGGNGSSTQFGSLETMVGGGGGAPTVGYGSAGAGNSGGSGGGGGGANNYGGGPGTAGQGTEGGNGNYSWQTYNCGGGGGKGYRGAYASNSFWSGGIGASNNYKTGSNIDYAGGGGAGGGNSSADNIKVMGGGDWGGGTSSSGTGNPGDDNQSYGAGNGGGASSHGGDGGSNTGGGGGGNGNGSQYDAGNGGSGIVVIRWAT